MRALILLLVISSLVGCAGVQRPDANICGINAVSSNLRCYNIKNDYSNDGTLDPKAKPVIIPLSGLNDLNAGLYFSPLDLEKLKVWIGDMRNWAKAHCK
jgi:hypothetical protein